MPARPVAGEPPTPYLRVDVARVRRNVRTAARAAAGAGVALRPHVKTHKSAEIARLQLAEGAAGLTVATLAEAEAFAAAGATDLFVAYPLWVDDTAGRRLRDLLDRVTLGVGIDSLEGAAALGRWCGGDVAALVEVDSGHHRTGVPPAEAGELAAAALRTGLRVAGVFTFPGHAYAPGAGGTAAADEAQALAVAAAALEAAGVDAPVRSGGSTPSLAAALDAVRTGTSALTELRPGVQVLGDAQQWELGAADPDDLALTCRGTVVSHAGGRVVLDAGSKALGADRPGWTTGWGRVREHPAARVVLLSEHHAVLDWGDPADPGTPPLPAVGSRLDVVPNHVCAAVNLADDLYADHGGGGPLEAWPVLARGPGG